jgi:hypothetical protein
MGGTILALAAALLLLMPLVSMLPIYNAYGITSSLFVSQSIKNTSGKAIQQLNAGQQAMISVRVLNHEASEQPFTTIIDVRDGNDVSVHIAWMSGTAEPGGHFDVELPWSAQESGSYMVRTFLITNLESPEVISGVSRSQLMVTESDTLKESFVAGNLSGIAKLAVISNGVQHKVWFTLVDQDGKQTTHDGRATIKITDSLGELRYTGTVPVEKSDFILFKPNEQSAANIAYVWTVPMIDVKRGLGAGTAVLTFVSSDGKSYSAKFGPIEIYQAYGDELAQVYESQYNKFANDIGKSIVKGNFKITLVKAGQFTHLANTTSGDEVTHYRADLVIENAGDAVNSWPSEYLIVDDKSNEYNEMPYGATLHAGGIVPAHGKTRGYVLFEDVNVSASWATLILKGNNYSNDPKDVLEFHIPL